MKFIVRLTHSPDNCWARPENQEKATEFQQRLENVDEELGVTVHSAFVAPNEHTFYLVLDAESFEGVVGLLGPPVLEDHEADITPVMSIVGAMDVIGIE
ncbi:MULTISPECIES: DUF3303 family protein [Haloferax]|uniref:GYD domain-containing protein n=2 Tax=Haloferax TaxID=2251 RepID=A0A6G1YZK9_9EURY|nr:MULTISPECIES: DUF3303 family protein [Haloferax]KAB1186942.1 hypothetical protein Hfx1149_02415 [Haloferax sp. CBA1149]MRW79571.1 hypothetical protein [Haloferax marinisediminis]